MKRELRLVFDNLIFFLQKAGGVSVYWSEILRRLHDGENAVVYLEPKGTSSNICYATLRSRLANRIVKERMNAKLLSLTPSAFDLDDTFIFHSSYYRIAHSPRAINIVTIHDFMPEMFFTGVRRFFHVWRKKKAIERADGIICVSNNTYTDLLRFYPHVRHTDIAVIPLGISADYFSLSGGTPPIDGVSGRPCLLFVGRRSHYKNFDIAVGTLKALPEYALVVAGDDWTSKELDLIEPVKERVKLVKSPSNEQMNVLYNGAFCLVYPSLYEGFGIPVLEAMAAGCPVVAIDSSSIPEVANGAGILLERAEAAIFAAGVRRLEDPGIRRKVIESGKANVKKFSWERSFSAHMEFYHRVYAKFAPLRAGQRK